MTFCKLNLKSGFPLKTSDFVYILKMYFIVKAQPIFLSNMLCFPTVSFQYYSIYSEVTQIHFSITLFNLKVTEPTIMCFVPVSLDFNQ